MIFSRLKLHNIGLYKGENTFNLIPKKNKNIILFGGKNGAGKTTILESIKLCLYGNSAFEYEKSEYKNFIKKTIHRGEKKGSIELEFIYFTERKKEHYKVVRKFDISNFDKPKEEFILYKNEEILKDIPKDYWQEFIFDIIPPRLVNFFFFDGEKIEKLADDLTETQFIDDIKTLIGVSLIDELSKSLGILEKRYLDEKTISTNLEKLNELNRKKELLEKKLAKYKQEEAQLKQKVQIISKDLKKVEKEFMRKGGKLFKDFDNLKVKKEILIKEIENTKNEIKELSSKDLPLAVGLDLLEELIKQLDIEREIVKSTVKEEILKSKLKELENILSELNIAKNKIEEIKSNFLNIEKPKGKLIHNLSDNDIFSIKHIYKNLKEETISKSKKLFEKLEKLEEELAQVEIALESVPDEYIISPYLREISRLEKEKAKLEADLEKIIIEIKRLEEELKQIEKEIGKINKIIEEEDKTKRIINLIYKSKRVLSRFKGEFTKRKLSILKREILEALSKLERKKDFIVDLDIDFQTFEISLFDRYGKRLPLDKLSAGERQIFAISFLWGLAKTSGKAIPVIIDTPLGRLDSEHRENLALNYFPNISHQVILLSTDTEIDKHLYKLMKKYISHSYHLVYNDECICTQIEEGYFWNKKKLVEAKNEV